MPNYDHNIGIIIAKWYAPTVTYVILYISYLISNYVLENIIKAYLRRFHSHYKIFGEFLLLLQNEIDFEVVKLITPFSVVNEFAILKFCADYVPAGEYFDW